MKLLGHGMFYFYLFIYFCLDRYIYVLSVSFVGKIYNLSVTNL